MIIEFYQHLPEYIDPIAFSIGSFSVRWYALSYLVGFVVVYLVLLWRIRNGEFKEATQIFNFQPCLPAGRFPIFKKKEGLSISKQTQNTKKNSELEIRNTTLDLLLISFFSALVGGRLGYVLLYDGGYFLSNPMAIISPYNQNGVFVGLYGMSYHGALLGIIIGSYLFLKIKKLNFLAWADFVVPGVALGYFFGRIGNFLNGELYGRMTNSFLGMYFPGDPNHLRHPSQLYEAILEGLLMFAILWKIRSASWRKKFKSGSLLAIYLFAYGLMRILVEQFRGPDVQIGFLWNFFTMGQILSFAMVLSGVGLFWLLSKSKK